MKVHVLGSGSGGNAVVLETGRETVLVDAGFSPRRLKERMQRVGVSPEQVTALLLTHEHGDHISGARFAAARWNWLVYGTPGTLRGGRWRKTKVLPVEPRRELALEDLTFRFVRTPHDAREPVALVATSRSSGVRVGIAYDLGHVTQRFADHFADVDVLLLEANHDEEMLRTGPYPWPVKQRVAGPRGHLNNGDAGAMARSCAHHGLRHLVLCHLSRTNNVPEVAIHTVRRALRGSGFRGTVQAADQDEPLTVSLSGSCRPAQLSLVF
jgi:phosphoribosyl 1,2-cyclic phosphodiesterase